MRCSNFILGLALPLALTSSAGAAFAKDKPVLRQAVECMPAKDIVKLLSKFEKLDADQRDTVDAVIDARFIVDEGQAMPDRMFARSDGEETEFPIALDGRVDGFGRIGSLPKSSELCVEDQARAGLPKDQDGVKFNMDFDVKFKDETGRYSLAQLRDGAKDGKSFYKKLVPAPIRLILPKMTHVSVTFDDPGAPGQTLQAFDGERLVEGLIAEPFGDTLVVEIDHLEALGADTFVISGGEYDMEPSPSIEKMKKLGFSEEGQETPSETEDK